MIWRSWRKMAAEIIMGGGRMAATAWPGAEKRAALLALAEAMAICNLICLQEDYGAPGSQDSPEPADRDKSEAGANFLDIPEEDGLVQEREGESFSPSDRLEVLGQKGCKRE